MPGRLTPVPFVTTLFVSILVFAACSVMGQPEEPIPRCGSSVSPEEAQAYLERGIFEVPFLQEPPYCVPIAAHIVRQSDGTGGLSQTQYDQAIQDANIAYANVGIVFYTLGGIDYIDSDDFYFNIDTTAEIDALRGTNVVPDAINIYFMPNLANEYGGLCGISSFTFSATQGIVTANDCTGLASNPSTFPHEIGHYFDLFHTHETVFGDELVDRSNCTTAGDLLCDTPADPNVSGLVNASCVYTGTAVDTNGDAYVPDPRQYMSYSRKLCRDIFSPLSEAKILNTLLNLRSNLLNQACPAAEHMIAINDVDQSADVDELLRVGDLGTGVCDLVGPLGDAFVRSEAIAVLPDPGGDRIFVVDDDRLLELDPLTGNGTEIGPIGYTDVDGLAFHPQSSLLYGVTHGSNLLLTIDITDGHGTEVAGDVIVGRRLNDIAFHPDGRAFILTGGSPRIYEVDINTGAKLQRWVLSGASSLESLLWSLDGVTLYSAADRDGFKDLVTIDLASSTISFMGNDHSGFGDLEGLAWSSGEVNGMLLQGATTTDVAEAPRAVTRQLHQNTPNPFNPATRIGFSLQREAAVELSVYTVTGRRVATLLAGRLGAGEHHVTWSGRSDNGELVAAGVYEYVLQAGDRIEAKKMVLVK